MDLEIIDEGVAQADGPVPQMVCCWWIMYPAYI